MDGNRSSGNDSSLLLRKGQPDPSTVVVVHQEVYADLRQAAVARLPGGTAGALLGNVQLMGGQSWYTVHEAAALDLEFTENGLAPEPRSLERLRQRVEGATWHDLSVIGMFYADPEIGLYPARMDIGEIHRQLTPDASLLLLMNPSIDQGAFCLWREGALLPVGGFYEALPEQSTSIIPWTGDWATMLMGAAGSIRAKPDPVRGRTGRSEARDQAAQPGRASKSEPNGAARFDMKSSARPEAAAATTDGVEGDAQPELPEENMASEAIDRISALARRLEAEGNVSGAVLLYRQALSLAPIIGDIALELRLRSTLNRLEEQVTLLEQDITQAATTAWAEARERAAQAQQAERAQRDSSSQTGGRQRTAVDELFDMGLAAFWRGDLLHARNVLAEVVRHEPAYRTEQHRAANLLAGVERRLALPPPSTQRQASPRRSQSRGKVVATGGVWRKLAVVALPVVAVLVVLLFAMSPAAPRAQESRATSTPGVAQVLPSTSDLPAADPAATVDAFVAANGDVARFGQPLSPLLDEAVDGVYRTVRYYERALVEFSEGAAPEGSVGILPLGALELARRYPQGAPAGEATAGDDLFFEGTGFALSGAFREFWERPGNAAMLGQPVSGVFEEVDGTGAVVDVQYFEFGALRRPAVDRPAPVEAAPLGAERYKALYSNP